MNRPKTYTAAAIVQFLLSALNGIGSIPFLLRGAARRVFSVDELTPGGARSLVWCRLPQR